MHFNIHNLVCNKPQEQRGRSLKKSTYVCGNNPIQCHHNILSWALWNTPEPAKELKLLSFFSTQNSWPYSVSTSTFCLTCVLNCKGAQQMKTRWDEATAASNSGTGSPGCRGLLLNNKVTRQCQQNSLGSMQWALKWASRFLLLDRVKVLKGESSSVPRVPTSKQSHTEGSRRCSLERTERN